MSTYEVLGIVFFCLCTLTVGDRLLVATDGGSRLCPADFYEIQSLPRFYGDRQLHLVDPMLWRSGNTDVPPGSYRIHLEPGVDCETEIRKTI